MLDALFDGATITGGVVAAAAIIGFCYGIFRRTVGRRGDHYRRLQRLGTNAQVRFFTSTLGQPPAMQTRRASTDSSGAKGMMAFDYLWVDQDYFVAALADADDSVRAFAITTRTKSFQPHLQAAKGSLLRIRLGRTRFSDIKVRPTSIRSTLGARRFGYSEVYYLGNPGCYQHFVCGVNDAGHYQWGRLDMTLGNLNHAPVSPQDSLLDGSLKDFRRTTRVNTWIVLSPGFDPKTAPLLLWPDLDSLRTFSSSKW